LFSFLKRKNAKREALSCRPDGRSIDHDRQERGILSKLLAFLFHAVNQKEKKVED